MEKEVTIIGKITGNPDSLQTKDRFSSTVDAGEKLTFK